MSGLLVNMAIHHAAASGIGMQAEQTDISALERGGNFSDQTQPIRRLKGEQAAISRQNGTWSY